MYQKGQVRNNAAGEATSTRQEKIAQGRLLVASTTYPSEEVIGRVAELLARHWPTESRPSQSPD